MSKSKGRIYTFGLLRTNLSGVIVLSTRVSQCRVKNDKNKLFKKFTTYSFTYFHVIKPVSITLTKKYYIDLFNKYLSYSYFNIYNNRKHVKSVYSSIMQFK